MNRRVISIRNHIHHLPRICFLSLLTSKIKLTFYRKVPEAWCGQEDKYSKLLLGFYFTYHMSLCSVFECKTCRPPASAVVHVQSALFGQALLWLRCCKKEKKNPRNKATEHHLSLSFVLVSRESFLWRKPWQDSQKPPINILVRKVF